MSDPDPRVTCLECVALSGRPDSLRCARHKAAGLRTPFIGPTLAQLPQHCYAFERAKTVRLLQFRNDF